MVDQTDRMVDLKVMLDYEQGVQEHSEVDIQRLVQGTAISNISRMVRLKNVLKMARILLSLPFQPYKALTPVRTWT